MGHLLEWDRYWGGWTISIGAGGGQPAQRFNFSEEFLADPFMVRQGSPRPGYFAVRPELLSKGERQYDAGGRSNGGILGRRMAPHDELVACLPDLDLARAVEVDHRPRRLVERRLLRHLLDEDLRRPGGQLEALGVHQVAFVADLDPGTVAGDAEDDEPGALDAADDVVLGWRGFGHGRWNFSLCHPEPFGCARGRLREGSLREILPRLS